MLQSVANEIMMRYAALSGGGMPTFSEARVAARRERQAAAAAAEESTGPPKVLGFLATIVASISF
jgi:hypothetical protein